MALHCIKPKQLLILIPAYNEEGAIQQVVNGACNIVPQADILVVDDGSTDETAGQALQAGAIVLRHPFNLGIGGAVQTGLKFARKEGYEMVIRLDGDGQHNPAEIPRIFEALQEGQADVIFGSRFLTAEVDMRIPLSRRVGIRTFAAVVSLLTGSRATDTTSGFCGFDHRAVRILADYMPQDYPEVESRIILHKAGLTAMEIPANMHARLSGVSSINSWRSIYYAFKVLIAVFITTLKDVPPAPKEVSYANTH